jgi:GGDEF domain-containing protein
MAGRGDELSGAFAKRLRNAVPAGSAVGRWNQEGFAVVLSLPAAEAIRTAKLISEQLSGPYACLLDGKPVRPALQVTVAVVEIQQVAPDRRIAKVREFLGGD